MRKANQTTMQSEIFIVLMIFAILLFITVFQALEAIENEKLEIEEEKIALQTLIDNYKLTPKQVNSLEEALRDLKAHKQPPLIVLKEAEGYAFNTNSATLSMEFQEKLQGVIVEKIQNFASLYNCDVVEVYGYTDGEPFGRNSGSAQFDTKLHQCLKSGCDIDSIKSSSNLELGMQRAISVLGSIYPILNNHNLIKTIRPYSGGQFIDSNGEIANINDDSKNSSRRRIEIRLSRSPFLLRKILTNAER